jgi:hypothetical protein
MFFVYCISYRYELFVSMLMQTMPVNVLLLFLEFITVLIVIGNSNTNPCLILVYSYIPTYLVYAGKNRELMLFCINAPHPV